MYEFRHGHHDLVPLQGCSLTEESESKPKSIVYDIQDESRISNMKDVTQINFLTPKVSRNISSSVCIQKVYPIVDLYGANNVISSQATGMYGAKMISSQASNLFGESISQATAF